MLLGRYEVIRKLGTGGFGEVLLARSLGAEGFERIVALKRLKGELARKAGSLQGIINEARIGGLLSHPNVVQVLEFIQVESDYLLVMEYVDGIALQEVMELERTHQARLLNPALAFDVAIQACEGLHYAHAARAATGQPLKLIHRDIKPSNLMITRTGTVKVMDFGVARSVTNMGQSSTGSIKGTLRYLSPEQAEGSKEIRHESDLFSLGLVLTELILGHPVYDADQEHVVLLKALQARVESGVDEAEKLVPGLGPILKRCLAKLPEDRFRTADELGQALRLLRARQSSTEGGLATLVERAMLLRSPDPFKDELSTDTTFSLELRRKELAETRAVEGRGARSRLSPGRIPEGRRLGASSPLVQIPGPRPGGDAPTEDMPRQLVKDILQKAGTDPWEWEWRLHEQGGKSWVGEVFDRAAPPSSPRVPVQPPPAVREQLQAAPPPGPARERQDRATDPGRGRSSSDPQRNGIAESAPAQPGQSALPAGTGTRPATGTVRVSQGDALRREQDTIPVRTTHPPSVQLKPEPAPSLTGKGLAAPAPMPAVVSLWGDMMDIKVLHETTPGTPIPVLEPPGRVAHLERPASSPAVRIDAQTSARSDGARDVHVAPLSPPAPPSVSPAAATAPDPGPGVKPGGLVQKTAPRGTASDISTEALAAEVATSVPKRPESRSEAGPNAAEPSLKETAPPRPGTTSAPKSRARDMGDWESRSTTQIERSALPQLLEQARRDLHTDASDQRANAPAPPLAQSTTPPLPTAAPAQPAEPKEQQPIATLPLPMPDAQSGDPKNMAPPAAQVPPASPVRPALAPPAPGPAAGLPPEPLEEVDALDDDDDDVSAAEVSRMDMVAELDSISIPSAHVAVIQQRMMAPQPERAKVRKPSITQPQARTPVALQPPPAPSAAPAAAPDSVEQEPVVAPRAPAVATPQRSTPSRTTGEKRETSPAAPHGTAAPSASLPPPPPLPNRKQRDEDEEDEPSTGTISKRLRTARDRAAPKPFVTDTGEFNATVTKMLLDAALKEEAEKALSQVHKNGGHPNAQDEVTDGPRAATRKVALAQLSEKPTSAVSGVALEDLPTKPGHAASKKEETTAPLVRLASPGRADASPVSTPSSDQEGTRTRRVEQAFFEPPGAEPEGTATRVLAPAGTSASDSTRSGVAPSPHARTHASSVLTVLGVEPDPGLRLTSSALAFAVLLGLGLLAAGFLLGVFWERAQHAAPPVQQSGSVVPAP